MVRGNGISAHEIAQRFNQLVDQVVPQLLPAAVRGHKFWEVGSVAGEPGRTLKINRTGARMGLWTDFNAPEGSDAHGGDLLQLAAVASFGGWQGNRDGQAKAILFAKRLLGIDDGDPAAIARVRHEAAEAEARADEAAQRQAERLFRSAVALWQGAVPIAGTPAAAYLAGRGIDFAQLGRVPRALRYRPDVWCSERRGKFPAMVATIVGWRMDPATGEETWGQIGAHRTYLDITGWDHARRRGRVVKQASIADAKRSIGAFAGGHIPLWKGEHRHTLREISEGTPVYVSEGIEDGLSIAMAHPERRVLAGVAGSNMGGLWLPKQAGPLVLIGQNDPPGSKAAEAFERVVQRQQEAGRRVQTIFPPVAFKDFNDQLCGKPREDA